MKNGALLILAALVLAGCCTCKGIPVQTVTNEIHHTERVYERDTIWEETTTVVREVDSVALAQYGIRMEQAQRAWLVESKALQKQIRELQQQEATHDTVTIVQEREVPVTVEVEKPLTWWQQTSIRIGHLSLALGVLTVGYIGLRRWLKR